MRLKKIISTVLLLAMTVSYLIPIHVIANTYTEPILWYDFEEGAKDISGGNLDGTVNGAVIKNGIAIFDGADDYIQIPDGILQNADSATIAVCLNSEIEKQISLHGVSEIPAQRGICS